MHSACALSLQHTQGCGCVYRQRRAYKVKSWTDADDFLTQLATAAGKLHKGGEPDLNTAAKMVLFDWQRGRIPFFTMPPEYEEADAAVAEAAAEAGPSGGNAVDDGGLVLPSEAVTVGLSCSQAASLSAPARGSWEPTVGFWMPRVRRHLQSE